MDDQQFNEIALEAQREKEVQQLYERTLDTNKPTNDTKADLLFGKLHYIKRQVTNNEKQRFVIENHKKN